MRKLSSIALVGIAIVLATASFGYAAGSHGGGHRFAGGQGFAAHAPSGHFQGHPAFNGRHFDGRRFDGRRFDRRVFVGGAFIGAPFYWPYAYAYPYADAPAYTYQAPAQTYWYYCPSYGAYYPSVQTCPDAWVPVPA